MKRRITIDQLNQLTCEQKVKLREWWMPKIGDAIILDSSDLDIEDIDIVINIYSKIKGIRDTEDLITSYSYDADDYYSKKYCLPILDIGQMIELLKQYWEHVIIEFKDDYYGNFYWDLTLHERLFCKHIEKFELVDALWEAVKEAL